MREVPFYHKDKIFPVYFEQNAGAPLEPQTYNEFHIRLYCKKRYAKNEARYLFKFFKIFIINILQSRLQKILLEETAELYGSPRNGLV